HAALVAELLVEALEAGLAGLALPQLRRRLAARQQPGTGVTARKRRRRIGVERGAIAGLRLVRQLGQRGRRAGPVRLGVLVGGGAGPQNQREGDDLYNLHAPERSKKRAIAETSGPRGPMLR